MKKLDKKTEAALEAARREQAEEFADDIGEFIMAGGEPKDAYHHLKKLERDLKTGLKEHIKAIAERQYEAWSAYKPVERINTRLRKQEFDLRKDVMNAILETEVVEPPLVRLAVKQAGQVFDSKDPGSIAEALDFLVRVAADSPVEEFESRYLELYPPEEEPPAAVTDSSSDRGVTEIDLAGD